MLRTKFEKKYMRNLPSNRDGQVEADTLTSTDFDIWPGLALDLQVNLHVGEVSVKSVQTLSH